MTENKEKRYQDRIQLLEAKMAELELQTSSAKKCVYFLTVCVYVNECVRFKTSMCSSSGVLPTPRSMPSLTDD